jgi:hypothetical protein
MTINPHLIILLYCNLFLYYYYLFFVLFNNYFYSICFFAYIICTYQIIKLLLFTEPKIISKQLSIRVVY